MVGPVEIAAPIQKGVVTRRRGWNIVVRRHSLVVQTVVVLLGRFNATPMGLVWRTQLD